MGELPARRARRDKLTLNLGVRWEYEGGLFDPDFRLPRDMDLTQPIAGLQQTVDPRSPADVRAIMAQSAGQKDYSYNGAFYFDLMQTLRKRLVFTHATNLGT